MKSPTETAVPTKIVYRPKLIVATLASGPRSAGGGGDNIPRYNVAETATNSSATASEVAPRRIIGRTRYVHVTPKPHWHSRRQDSLVSPSLSPVEGCGSRILLPKTLPTFAFRADSPGEHCAKSLKMLAPRAGFEPATNRLTAGCSTAELPGNLDAGNAHRCGRHIAKGLGLCKERVRRCARPSFEGRLRRPPQDEAIA